jgi:hypothetical protein
MIPQDSDEKKDLLTFGWDAELERYVGAPHRIFRPQGLRYWGPREWYLDISMSGLRSLNGTSSAIIPAAWFWRPPELPMTYQPWGSWETLNIGNQIHIQVVDRTGRLVPFDWEAFGRNDEPVSLLMWGYSLGNR